MSKTMTQRDAAQKSTKAGRRKPTDFTYLQKFINFLFKL